MLDMGIVDAEIRELEDAGETTYDVCRRLSWLYAVMDHAGRAERDAREVGGSEFLDAANAAGFEAFAKVMEKHMEALKVVLPKEHEAVMARLARAAEEGVER